MHQTLLLLAESGEKWYGDFGLLWGVLVVLIMVVCAALLLMSKQREEIHVTEAKRADANEKLVKTRETELQDCEDALLEVTKERDRILLEYKSVLALKVDDLMKFQSRKEELEAKWANIEEENRRLKLQIQEKR